MGGCLAIPKPVSSKEFEKLKRERMEVTLENVTIRATADPTTQNQLIAIIRMLDKRGIRRMNYEEFCFVWTMFGLEPHISQYQKQIYECFDFNGDGYISMREFILFYQKMAVGGGSGGENNFTVEDWGYDDWNGPWKWVDKHFEADGDYQSPIDLDPSRAIKDDNQFSADDESIDIQYKDCTGVLTNNGNQLEWAIENGGHVKIRDQKYPLRKVIFRSPSEHKFNGEASIMCLQFIHQQSSTQPYFIFEHHFKISYRSNPFIDGLIAVPPVVMHSRAQIESIPLTQFDLLHGDYISYSGSMTMPPCMENVTWFINHRLGTISHSQMHWFKTCINFENVRPCQRANDRVITWKAVTCTVDGESSFCEDGDGYIDDKRVVEAPPQRRRVEEGNPNSRDSFSQRRGSRQVGATNVNRSPNRTPNRSPNTSRSPNRISIEGNGKRGDTIE